MFSKFAPKYAAVALSVVAALSLAGCKEQASTAQRAPQEVGIVTTEISAPVMTTELTGRTSAYQIAEVRPQISGIIQKRIFTEGQMVKAGDQLYQIDPALYEAAYEEAVANYELALANAKRSARLVKVNAVSKQDNDAAQAQMKTARAAMKTAKTNLDYTRVQSPISGRVGRSEVTPGALANAYQTFMTTVQQLDPIYVDVRQTSSEMLRLKHEIASGKIKAKDGAVEVTLLMEDGSVYPQKGKLTFTGTLEQSKANRSFGESYGMESVLFMLANATKEESVNYYQEHKEEMAKQIAEAICSYYGVQGENSETASQ